MLLKRMSLGVYGANCYIVTCEDSKESIVVDPGGEAEDIIKVLEENEFKIKYIVLTHGHGDHIAGVPKLKEVYGCPILIHKNDEELLLDPSKNLSASMPIEEVIINPDKLLEDGDIIEFGKIKVEVIHTPGHTQGCICLKIDKDILTGDTLFKGSVGRTDLYGSSNDIINSIKTKLLKYEGNTLIHPGHGISTTIGEEKLTNPFLR
ncbi:beta-lactamase domain protein [Gottschalkia purinilytica]|uniref:Beta-lactamase domain protein n=1 Tax=Gottschalkia purinilytica TaxID=1503 RepID=A0A0L0WB34_GOTPU|nr:MBL fold metallo-hydrolase [Gottschalkia purinilytica]KNF08701.1 beta-lactamase domain protein [Gottschalkia purinilytica]